MPKNRLEAFSDGVIAIIITIMVLELKVPHGEGVETLAPLIPIFLSYVLSFVYLGIYWNNHHHMFHAVQKVTGPVLYAVAIPLAFWRQWISRGLYVGVALLWLIPDRRIERVLRNAAPG